MTPASRKVALYILSAPGKVLQQTATNIALACGTSETAVVRFCKVLGYKGFHDFIIQLARDFGTDGNLPISDDISPNDSSWEIFQKVLAAEQESLKVASSLIKESTLTKVVDVIMESKRIGLFAVGSSFSVAYDAFWRFSKIGIQCAVNQDAGAQLMLAQSLIPGDLAIAVSRSGESRVPVTALRIARANSVATIALTQNNSSPIVKYSDYVLCTSSHSMLMHEAATASRTIHMAIMDAVYTAIAIRHWDQSINIIEKSTDLLEQVQF